MRRTRLDVLKQESIGFDTAFTAAALKLLDLLLLMPYTGSLRESVKFWRNVTNS